MRPEQRGCTAGGLALIACLTGSAGCTSFPKMIASNRETLAAAQPDVERHAWVHGAAMSAAVAGDPSGAPVVFVHGSPGSWDANAHLLANPELRAHHLLISYDRPGYGGSSPHQTEPSLARQAEALAGLLDALGVRAPVILVGHSMGGPVIARFAMDFPARTAGLVFIAASVDPDLEAWKWYNVAASWRLANRVLPEELIRSNEEIRPLETELDAMVPRWAQITAPAAIIHGTEDTLVPLANVPFLEAHLAGVPTAEWIVPGETHAILWHRPDLVVEAVRWLEDGPASKIVR